MKTNAYYLLPLILFFLSTTVIGQVQKDPIIHKKYAVAELKEDFNILRRHLQNYHPGLYQYTDQQTMDNLFDRVDSDINQPMTGIDFFRLLAPMLKSIGNGHTDIECPTSYKDATQQYLPRLPFHFYFDQGKLYIVADRSTDEYLKIPTEVKSIDGKNAVTLLYQFADRLTRDGYNETLPLKNACARFSLYYAYFIGTPDKFEMDIIAEDGSEKSVVVDAITLKEISANRAKRERPKAKSFWSDSSLPASTLAIDGKVATMTIKTFASKAAKKRGQPFKSWLDDSFAEIKKTGVEHLILDLRQNGGGDPMPTLELFSHLHDQPFTFYRETSSKTKRFKEGKYYDFPIWLLNIRGMLVLKKFEDRYKIRNMDGTKETQPAKDVFKGKLYVLTDPDSFSATGEMTAIIKEYNRAIFIGEEAGGNPNQNTSGAMLPMVLPNSKVRVTLPIILWLMNVNFENTGHGIIPDHPVRASVSEYLEEKDVVMDYTLKLIRSEK